MNATRGIKRFASHAGAWEAFFISKPLTYHEKCSIVSTAFIIRGGRFRDRCKRTAEHQL